MCLGIQADDNVDYVDDVTLPSIAQSAVMEDRPDVKCDVNGELDETIRQEEKAACSGQGSY